MSNFSKIIADHPARKKSLRGERSAFHVVYIPAPSQRYAQGESIDIGMFHFAAWLVNAEMSGSFYISLHSQMENTMLHVSESEKLILFSHRKDFNDFIEWKQRIKPWYIREEMDDCTFAKLPRSGSRTLHFVERERNTWIDDWSWITHNSIEPAWLGDGCFVFESAEDAVKFRLSAEK